MERISARPSIRVATDIPLPESVATRDSMARMTGVALSADDRAMLDGDHGQAARFAMGIVLGQARAVGADRLIDVTSAHIDGCLYHGQVSLDFAERLVGGEARVRIPSTLNVGAVDLIHPDLYRGDPSTAGKARRLMDLYVQMGCRPTWTCAPYQLADRPAVGEHIAWAESNAIVFANSVLGARTDRYGDFIDICAAITGRVPDAGLHRPENRLGQVLFRLSGVSDRLLHEDVLYPVLGHIVGVRAGTMIPVIEGLAPTTMEDQLKALGAAAASSGAVALFHAVGITPEAPGVVDAFGGSQPRLVVDVTLDLLREARDGLCTVGEGAITAVSLGTPHLSMAEFERLMPLLREVRVSPDVRLYVSTGRDALATLEARGWLAELESRRVTLVMDTCTYITPILDPGAHVVMTNSAKWAYYAPGNIGAEVVFGSTLECLRSAERGTVWRDPELWGGT
jgi:predicted aconitase